MPVKIVECVLNYHATNQPTVGRCVYVQHFIAETPQQEIEIYLQDIADKVFDLWGAAWKQHSSVDGVLASCVAQTVLGDIRSAGKTSNRQVLSGELNDIALPLMCTVNIQKKTAYSGRKYRGRVCLPYVPYPFARDGNLINDAVATIEAAGWGSIFSQQINIPGPDPDIWLKPCLAKRPWTVGALSSPRIITYNLDHVIRAQRRRQPGRGY